MKLVNKKLTWAILFISALALENFCWATPYYEYLIDGIFKYSDIGIVLAFVWCVYVFVLTKNIFNRKAMIWPAVFIVIAIICLFLFWPVYFHGYKANKISAYLSFVFLCYL